MRSDVSLKDTHGVSDGPAHVEEAICVEHWREGEV